MNRFFNLFTVLSCLLVAGVSSNIGAQTLGDDRGKIWNQSEIIKALNLEKNSSGMSWKFIMSNGTQCDVAVIMTTKGSVALYYNAGDVVATNPDKTAGVKITAAETRDCLNAAQKLLSSLK